MDFPGEEEIEVDIGQDMRGVSVTNNLRTASATINTPTNHKKDQFANRASAEILLDLAAGACTFEKVNRSAPKLMVWPGCRGVWSL